MPTPSNTTPAASAAPAINDPITSVISSIAVVIAGAVVGYMLKAGLINADDVAPVTATVVSLLAAAVGIVITVIKAWAHTKLAKVAAVAVLPDVSRIVTTHEIANSATFADSTKVVTPAQAQQTPAPVPVPGL